MYSLVHYTKKIVADATEHEDRRDGPQNEYGHGFLLLNKQETEEKRLRSRNLENWNSGKSSFQPSKNVRPTRCLNLF